MVFFLPDTRDVVATGTSSPNDARGIQEHEEDILLPLLRGTRYIP
jgi:hypothetical protein